jgi:DinB superfamily
VDRCTDCGFDYDEVEGPDAPSEIRRGADGFAELLAGHPDGLRKRVDPSFWSPLEYGCHLRDILLVQRERVLLARRAMRPSLEPMGRNERAEHDGYAEQDPGDVARQLRDAAMLLANDLARLGPGEWDRTVVYNYPAVAERTISWVASHTVHELRHHYLDARRQLG